MRVFACVHHVGDTASGKSIILATQAALNGGWVIGPRYPATHAFIVLEHDDGMRWRLDGMPPRALWSPSGPFNQGPPCAVWLIKQNADAIARRARELSGTEYDMGEIVGQAAVAAATMFRFLPFSKKLASLGFNQWARNAAICTRLTVECIKAEGNGVAHAVSAMPNLFPEQLGQVLNGLGNELVERVQ